MNDEIKLSARENACMQVLLRAACSPLLTEKEREAALQAPWGILGDSVYRILSVISRDYSTIQSENQAFFNDLHKTRQQMEEILCVEEWHDYLSNLILFNEKPITFENSENVESLRQNLNNLRPSTLMGIVSDEKFSAFLDSIARSYDKTEIQQENARVVSELLYDAFQANLKTSVPRIARYAEGLKSVIDVVEARRSIEDNETGRIRLGAVDIHFSHITMLATWINPMKAEAVLS